jgi:hypothetical protein
VVIPALKVKFEVPQGYAKVRHGYIRAKDLVVDRVPVVIPPFWEEVSWPEAEGNNITDYHTVIRKIDGYVKPETKCKTQEQTLRFQVATVE